MTRDPDEILLPIDSPDPSVSDPATLLAEQLDWYRDALVRKLDGLSERAATTPLAPMGWAPLVVVKHLGLVERRWLRWGFRAHDVAPRLPGGVPAEWRLEPDETVASVLAGYAAEVAEARTAIEGAALTDRAAAGGRFPTAGRAPTLGGILMHLLQEYARHVGQLDIVRELLDGRTGE